MDGPRAHRFMRITKFEDIEGWKAARQLNQELLAVMRRRPIPDHYLKRQIRKCPISAMANIAEGFDAGTNPEFVRFLRISYRSVTEFQSHLYVALDEGYLDPTTFDSLYAQAHMTKERIGGFMRYLRKHPSGRPPSVEP
jgi:four helix bundle protein